MTEEPEATPPPQKKGRFLFGCATGGVLVIVLQIAVLVIAFLIARPNLVDTARDKLLDIDVPVGTMDYGWELTTAEGETTTLEHLRGQVAVIHYWKPDCPYCEAELTSFEALAEKAKPLGVEFVMICGTDAEDFAEEAAEMGMTLPTLGLPGEFPESMTPTSAPTTYVIDREGNIVLRKTTAAIWDTEDALRFFENLVAGE